MRNVMAAVLVVLLLAGGALAGIRAFAAHKADASYQALKTSQDAEARKLLPRFIAFEDSLRSDPFFTAARPDKDAGAFLNARVPWSVEPSKAPAAKDAPRLIGSDISPALEKQLSDWGKAWPTHSADVDFGKLDLGWMAELQPFGSWDLTVAPSPVLSHLEGGWASFPLPNFVGLMRSTKLRLLQGLATEKPLEAARDVRQLAWLCYRTETVIGGAIASALLAEEQAAHEAWLAAGHPAVEGWTPMSTDQLARFKAVTRASMAYAAPSLDPKIYDEAYAGPGLHVGQCAALTERAGILALLRSAPGGESSELLKSIPLVLGPVPGCDLKLAKLLWEQKLPPMSLGAAGAGISDTESFTTRLMPTDALIKTLMTVATVSGLGDLEAKGGGAP